MRPAGIAHPLAQPAAPLDLAYFDKGGHQPEGADGERTLLAGEPVVGLLDAISEHQAFVGELVGNSQDRRPDTGILRWQEA